MPPKPGQHVSPGTEAKPGDQLALKHGARSERAIAPIAGKLLAAVLSDPNTPEYLRDPVYRGALIQVCRADATCQLLSTYIGRVGMDEAIKGRNPALDQLRRWTGTSLALRKSLGLTPDSRSRIMRDLAATQRDVHTAGLDKLQQIGAEIIEQHGGM